MLLLFYTGIASAQKTKVKSVKKHAQSSPELVEGKDFVPGTIILKLNSNWSNGSNLNLYQIPQAAAILNELNIVSFKQKFPNHQALPGVNAGGMKYINLSVIYELRYSNPVPVQIAVSKLLSLNCFEYVEPHYLPQLIYQPNDPQSNPLGQYYLARINAYKAWDTYKGDTSVVIGIIDTGTEPNHEDLQFNVYLNRADPLNGVDDDNDGYIDNFKGWDLGMEDNDPRFVTNPHGVHVTGIAAASTDNGKGIAGVGFKCRYLPVKITEDITGTLTAAYEGIVYAADHGAQIINCSWGGSGGGNYGQDIIDYATINKNCLVVAGAGNNGNSEEFYPAFYKHVISVAATDENDIVTDFSNYSYEVDVCAPGKNINSTWIGNAYLVSDGTSMASPCAAGVAAVIKSKYPFLTGMQVGEILKATTDTIPVPIQYENKLGTGRVNLFKAVTVNPSSFKSLEMDDIHIADKNDSVFVSGDTLYMVGEFINYLAPLTNAKAELVPINYREYMEVIDSTTTLGPMFTMGKNNNLVDPFKFVIKQCPIKNVEVTFKVTLTDNGYKKESYFTLTINVDYINVTVNQVHTTITSRGRIGYNEGQTEGLGFRYKNIPLLFEGGFMIGASPIRVSDCIRNGIAQEMDFSSKMAVREINPTVGAMYQLFGKFDDSLAKEPVGVTVIQRSFASSQPFMDKFVMTQYTIKNNTTTDINNVYGGIFADWDIDEITFDQNKSAYDSLLRMGYSWSTMQGGYYAGIKLLSTSAPPVFYAIDNVNGGAGGVDIYADFTKEEKYTCLSTNRLVPMANTTGAGGDVANVMSSGPFLIAGGDSIRIAYALLVGDNLKELQQGAVIAQHEYDVITGVIGIHEQTQMNMQLDVFPNPAKEYISIRNYSSLNINGSVEVLDILGRKIEEFTLLLESGTQRNIHLPELKTGVYLLRIRESNNLLKQIKLSIE